MAKVEVLREKGAFVVQVTFREPFEYFFEIAVHRYRFDHPRDARRLAERVRSAIKAGGYQSPSIALSEDHWQYRSSAYEGRMKAVESVSFLASDRAKAEDDAQDRAA